METNQLNFKIEKLEWDSDFFNLNIGRLIVENPIKSWSYVNSLINESKFDLIYLFVSSNIAPKSEIEENVDNLLWVDGKITYLKKISQFGKLNKPKDDRIIPVYELDEEIKDLAIQTGLFSRFKIDSNFGDDEYKKLYVEWITQSINRTIAEEVLVYLDRDKKSGLITLGAKNGRADIGLVGVDNSMRGNPFATKLIEEVEHIAFEKKFEYLQVVTQQENIAACRLYEKYGFSFESLVNIFHVWKKNEIK